MPDRYAVIGNPIAHSKSPIIQTAFAQATGQDMSYERLLAPLDAFRATVERFAAEGGLGLNVTIPFKEEALALADRRTTELKSRYRLGKARESEIFSAEAQAASLRAQWIHLGGQTRWSRENLSYVTGRDIASAPLAHRALTTAWMSC